MTKKQILAAAFAAPAILAAAGPAAAETYAFRYKSHELETQGGREDLMARLDRFVDNLCEADGVRGLAVRAAAAKCKAEVKNDIMAKIDNVAFAALN